MMKMYILASRTTISIGSVPVSRLAHIILNNSTLIENRIFPCANWRTGTEFWHVPQNRVMCIHDQKQLRFV